MFDQNNNTSLVAANEVLNADNEAIGVTLFNENNNTLQDAMQQDLVPDLDQARRHLQLLAPNTEQFVFQTFDDNKERKDKRLIRVLSGPLVQHAAQLKKLNAQGAGVFVTVNRSKNGRRKKADIDGFRAIFREADEPGLPALPLDPHIVIETSPGKQHEYLLLEHTEDGDTWDEVMQTVVEQYGSDPNAKDRSRVLRLAGFFHLKNFTQPHMVSIIKENNVHPYSLAEVANCFPPVVKVKDWPMAPDHGRAGTPYGLAALTKEIEILQETMAGGRNAQLNKAAYSLGQLVAGDELDYDSVEGELLLTAISIGLSEAEAKSTIKSGMEAGVKAPRTAPSTSMNDEEWPDAPVSLGLPETPPFTGEDFPADLWDIVQAVSKSTETPPELAGMIALAVIGTACQRRFVIEIESGYWEPLNIWTLLALGPGNRKSAVLKIMVSPLSEWEIVQATIQKPSIGAAQFQRETQEGRLKELQKQYARAADENKRQEISKQMEDLRSQLKEIPVRPQLIVQDVTPEHLGTVMGSQGERIAVFSAEGGIFENMAGRYSNGNPNLDIFLQSHSGDSVRVDRGSRDSIWLDSPALTMGLCVQPEVLKSMASKPGFRGRGLVARFFYALPFSPLGHRTLVSVPVAAAIDLKYRRTIELLLKMPLPKDDVPIIKLSPEALGAWKVFQRWVETGLAEGGEFEHMRDWAGKLPGAVARIAGLFHCYEYADKKPHEHPVNLQTMGRALSLAKKLSGHAVAVYDLMAADATIEGARKILSWINRMGCVSFTGHECHSALKGRFKTRKELDPALQVLVERGYIRKMEAQGERKVGRPRGTYVVHPSIQPG